MPQVMERRKEKRVRPRLPQALTISVPERSGRPRTLAAKVVDFSQGGIGLELFVPLPVGAHVYVQGEFHSDSLDLSVHGRGRVVYCQRQRQGNYRVGIALEQVAYRKPN